MREQILTTGDYLTKSNIPGVDFVINPYIGCPHACKYCYACFMKRFTNHNEPWGKFLDVKIAKKPISLKRIKSKPVFLSSVTDCYNPYEAKYKLMPGILEQLKESGAEVNITTKSNLILRDLEILKQIPNISVAMSINTLDENFKNDMDKASSIKERLEALKTLKQNGIHTILFMSPIFPYITDFKEIISATKNFIDEYWFENLKLRPPYKHTILSYIMKKYPEFYQKYIEIYVRRQNYYWFDLKAEIEKYCTTNNIPHSIFFYYR